ncbi:MAG: S8 family peptidase [Saprospiraceae bacterium]
MNHFSLLRVSFALMMFGILSCQKTEIHTLTKPTTVPDPGALDAFIMERLQNTGEFQWNWASDDMVWTAVANADFVLSVGFQPAGAQDVLGRIHEINLSSAEWADARSKVLQMILASEQRLDPALTAESLIAYPEAVLPVLDVYVRNPETIELLRQSPLVRYAEPMGYEPGMTDRVSERSGSGCDNNTPEPGLTTPADYANISPSTKQSWNHSYHNITQAWSRSTGDNVRIMIIDTGASDDQDNLGSQFNQGNSTGRNITRLVTLPRKTLLGIPIGPVETPHDQCGHGTSMIGACAAPRGTDGAATGIAYNCDITSVRAAADVYLDESREVKGVSDAFTLAGNTESVRIISMSMGRLTSSSQMKDAITYAYNKGKLIFCAAGTSFSWTGGWVGVIYPASLSECVAVTGIKDNLTNRCNSCHQGSKVDFVLVMEKNSNERTVLSLADSGNDPSTVGGSSVATASTAGIAALVWAKYPGWSRQQVFDRLKTSGSYYPNRNGNFGWGRVDADEATQ